MEDKMKRVSIFCVLALLLSAVCLVSADTWKGSISDKMCGGDHHGKDAVACTRGCVKGGSPYVLVVNKDKILDIDNQKDAKIAAELDKYAGQTVSITGTASKDGKSLKVDSIKAGK
jgi:hypothetical protein